jgi:lipooligosaccharide transport system permease protein
METHHVYEAILFTPLEPEDIVMGEVIWGATRSVLTGVAVLVAILVFGLVDSPMAIAVIPSAFLIGVAVGSLAMTYTAVAPSIGSLNNFFTLFVVPMSFFCGIFFPVDRLPAAAQVAAWALPLTPGVALIRGFTAGDLSWMMLLWVLELVVVAAVGLTMASILLRRRLVK